jgi:lipopolysaccharide export system protein LptA
MKNAELEWPCKFHALMTSIPAPIRLHARRGSACALFALALLLASPAQAEKADRLKPLNVEADAGRYDDLKQFGVFSGNVVLSKGSLLMRAGQIDVRQTAEGFHQSVALAASGKLAYFKQKREGLDETIEGEAERIEYDAKADTLRLQNRAVIRRMRAGVVVDETVGNVITYDNTSEVFTVVGGSASASPANPGGRVRAVLSPRDGTPAAQEAASAGVGANPSPPPLKSTPVLGDRK